MQEILKELQEEGYVVDTLDISHLSPARFAHINRLGKYSFEFNESKLHGTLRQLRKNA